MSAPNDRRVVVQYACGRQGVPAANSLRRWANLALADAPGEVVLRVVDEAESGRLNARYRRRHYPTNVLSFPAEPLADGSRPWLGDLVIAAPVVAREAAAQGKPQRAHWAHLVIHGCLHLLGYDHRNDAEADEMEARERRLLERLGYPDPYEKV
ncbi:MAG: rRNA maturation RNase YbeY [Gammaproteobacteria bacterium]|nr:rRNA maturation RNase YbeY [Gammaproteobacteria bacterium]